MHFNELFKEVTGNKKNNNVLKRVPQSSSDSDFDSEEAASAEHMEHQPQETSSPESPEADQAQVLREELEQSDNEAQPPGPWTQQIEWRAQQSMDSVRLLAKQRQNLF